MKDVDRDFNNQNTIAAFVVAREAVCWVILRVLAVS